MKGIKFTPTAHLEFRKVIQMIQNQTPLPEKYRDHALVGEYVKMRECHIKPDLLLIYYINKKTKIVYLERIGSHSELF